MIGGLVVVERLFNYNGVGELILNAARTVTTLSCSRWCW